MIEVVVYPAEGVPGNYVAEVAGTVVVKSSKTPLLSAARVLLGERWDGGACEIGMRHRGVDHIALRSTVGKAAGLAVEEGNARPVFVKWRPYSGR